MTRTALIDADELVYKISSSYQDKYYTILKDEEVLWKCRYKEEAVESIGNRDDLEMGIGYTILTPTKRELNEKIDKVLDSILTSTNSSSYKLFLSGPNNFRYERATLLPYKGNRTEEKPIHYGLVKSFFEDRGAESIDFLEADDLLSIHESIAERTVICSSDKDLKTVPSVNYSIKDNILTSISEDEATYNFYYQLLIGDTVDNIPSPYLLGKVKASTFLMSLVKTGNPINYYQAIIPFYSKFLKDKDKDGNYKTSWYSGQDVEEVLLEIGDLLWMRRTLDPTERWSPNG